MKKIELREGKWVAVENNQVIKEFTSYVEATAWAEAEHIKSLPFKIGATVKVLDNPSYLIQHKYVGKEGKVIGYNEKMQSTFTDHLVTVEINGGNEDFWEHELEEVMTFEQAAEKFVDLLVNVIKTS